MTDHRYYRHPTGEVYHRTKPAFGYAEPVVVIPAEVVTDAAMVALGAVVLRSPSLLHLYDALDDACPEPEPEPPTEPMSEDARVEDRQGDLWGPMRDGTWVALTGDGRGCRMRFHDLSAECGPLTIYDDEGDEE